MNARTLLESTSAALPARERRTLWKALENCCAREWLPAQAREGSHFGASIAECMPMTGPAQRAYFTHGTAAATVEEMACRQHRHQRFRTYILTCPVTILLALCTVACSRSREYELRGQVLAVNAARQEITVKHEDIRGFMPAMTMPFRVENAREIEGRRPGELVRATLVVETNDAYLKNVERTGEAPLTSAYLSPSSAVLLAPGEAVAELAFIDQRGQSHRLSEFRGRILAVTFIYTRCPIPDFCPLMDRHFASVQQTLAADDGLRIKVHLLSVSFDPEFDSPPVLAKHAARAGADPSTWSFVTGDREDVDTFAAQFGVSVMRGDASAQEILHNLRTAIIDERGRLVRVFTGNDWQPSQLVAELRATRDRG